MGYWIPVEGRIRIYENNLRDAYLDCAKILFSAYYQTNGNIHRLIPESVGVISIDPQYFVNEGFTSKRYVGEMFVAPCLDKYGSEVILWKPYGKSRYQNRVTPNGGLTKWDWREIDKNNPRLRYL